MRRALLTFVAMLALAAPAYAQYGVPGAEGAVSISMSPQYPAPGATVSLSLSSSLYDLDSSTIVWRANGIVIAQGIGVTSAALVAGGLGDETDVTASITTDNGSASTEFTIIPTRVNLLWESTSYTPPFYKGRALTSAGAGIALVALPDFGPTHAVNPSTLIYTWRKDGEVLGSISGRGKSSATIDGPTLYGATTITVDVTSASGGISGEASVHVADQPSVISLYEDHPLYGILYGQALGASAFTPENEASFVAVPYFAPVSTPNTSDLIYDWSINQSDLTPDSAHPNEITINAAKSSGVALIRLALSHAKNFFFNADGAWSITLNASPSGASIPSDPFRPQQ